MFLYSYIIVVYLTGIAKREYNVNKVDYGLLLVFEKFSHVRQNVDFSAVAAGYMLLCVMTNPVNYV